MNGDHDGLPGLFPYVIEELLSLRAEVKTLVNQSQNRNREIKFLHEVGQVLQTSVDLDEVLAMALTAITAGKGFGLNRAILLLVDKERQNLRGHFAVGPRSREEAGRIWHEVHELDLPLKEMANKLLKEKMSFEREKFVGLLEILTTPLSCGDHLFIRTLNGQKSELLQNVSQNSGLPPVQRDTLGVQELLLVPLISKNRRIGLLIADNVINGRPITENDVHSLETFALPVSFAIERASLYERLQEELNKLTLANIQLKEQQEQIVRMEKMALVGKIASNIAHTIRNPLTIIGGFARNLFKNTPEDAPNRTYIESIVRETRRLEEVLQEVLSYSESLHPTFDWWDINQLVTRVYSGVRDDLQLSKVSCRLDLAPGLPQAKVDYKKIGYCLRSILQNALEALPPGGEIALRTARQGDAIEVVVSDNGPGMSPETLKEATAPFFSTKESGSGLGLSLCARILEEHGTALEISSQEGVGTTFTMRLNIHRED